jgi:hypothetical protein
MASSLSNLGSPAASAVSLKLSDFRPETVAKYFMPSLRERVSVLKSTLAAQETNLAAATEELASSEKAFQEATTKVDHCKTALNQCQLDLKQAQEKLQHYFDDRLKILHAGISSPDLKEQVLSTVGIVIAPAEANVQKLNQKLTFQTNKLNELDQALLATTQKVNQCKEVIKLRKLERDETAKALEPEAVELGRLESFLLQPPVVAKALPLSPAPIADMNLDEAASSSQNIPRRSFKRSLQSIDISRADQKTKMGQLLAASSPLASLADLALNPEEADVPLELELTHYMSPSSSPLEGAGASSPKPKRVKNSSSAASASSSSESKKKKKPLLLSEFYTPGTRVYHEGKEGIVKSYNPETDTFTVTIEGKDHDLEDAPYYPKNGDVCLIQEVEENDDLGRYYKAKITDVTSSGNTLKVDYEWIKFKLTASRTVTSPKQILPLSKKPEIQSKQLRKLRSDPVQSNFKIVGTGYYLERKK